MIDTRRALFTALLCTLFTVRCFADAPPRHPNVVVIVSDDQGWNAIGYHGGFVQTPNLDRIAHSGVELDRAYVSPMCSPTREGIMTGRYPMRFGMGRSVVRPWAKWGLPPEERTLPEALGEAGYANRAAFGKWHMGHLDPKWHPLNQGFTDFVGCYNGAIDYFTRDRDGQVDWHENWNDVDPKGYTTDLIADGAVNFVAKHSRDKGPFFCYVAFTAPHEPLEAPQPYLDRYKNLEENGKPTQKQALAAMTTCMDDGVGRILKAIENAGIANDTLLWFVSDNGGINLIPNNNDPLRGHKLTVYEGGVRTPAAVWWPGHFEGGRKVETPLINVDMLPTIVKLCGGDVSKTPAGPLDGMDVSAVLEGKPAPDAMKNRDLYFFTGQDGLDREQIAVTTGDGWKLIVIGPDVRRPGGCGTPQHKVELFHLSDDLSEKTNLADKEPERVKEMEAKVIAFRQSEPAKSLPPLNRKPPKFVVPPHWHNAPATQSSKEVKD